jgi:hypothetical protein
MKNIIFEVIYYLIMQVNTPITYDTTTYQKLVEIINLNGMSVNKFKRILRILITDFFLQNDFYFLHYEPIRMSSEKEFENDIKKKLFKNLH